MSICTKRSLAGVISFLGLVGFQAAALGAPTDGGNDNPCKHKFCTQTEYNEAEKQGALGAQGDYTETLSVKYAFYSYQDCVNRLQETGEVSTGILTSGTSDLQQITDHAAYCQSQFPDNSTLQTGNPGSQTNKSDDPTLNSNPQSGTKSPTTKSTDPVDLNPPGTKGDQVIIN